MRGAHLVRVYGPDGPTKRDAGREAVTLAWAQMPDARWAILLAWAGYWMDEAAPHQTEAARWAWCVYDEDRVELRRAPQTLYEGAAWHGWAEDGELNKAIRQAAGSLPEHLREAAITPAERQGPE